MEDLEHPAAPAAVADLVMQLARVVRHNWMASVGEVGVTPHQARALATVLREEPLRIGELAAALRVRPRSATEVVDSLEAAGLLERTSDKIDRRATMVSATAEGRALAARVAALRSKDAEAMFDGLSIGDRAELQRIVSLVIEANPTGRASDMRGQAGRTGQR